MQHDLTIILTAMILMLGFILTAGILGLRDLAKIDEEAEEWARIEAEHARRHLKALPPQHGKEAA